MKFIFAKYGFGIWHIFIEKPFYQDCYTICGDRPLDDTYKSRWKFSDNISFNAPICRNCLEKHWRICFLYRCNVCSRLFILDHSCEPPDCLFICEGCKKTTMLAKNLPNLSIGETIFFQDGSNFSSPDFEFRATFKGTKSFSIYVDLELEFDHFPDQSELVNQFSQQLIYLTGDIYFFVENVHSRKRNSSDEWSLVKASPGWEALSLLSMIETEHPIG